MSDTEAVDGGVKSQTRQSLFRRLVDLVAMPSQSRVSQADRWLAADILLVLLHGATHDERELCAKRLAQSSEAPRRVLRYLARADFEIAEPLLTQNTAFDDCDLVQIVARGAPAHRLAIAQRRPLGPTTSSALVESADLPAIRALLANNSASLSQTALDALVSLSRLHPDLCEAIIARDEVEPAQAMTMFWWSGGDIRRRILQKHTAERQGLVAACAELFRTMDAADWNDAVVRTSMQLIERRQRNRGALQRSEFESLEAAIDKAAQTGMTAHIAQEVGYLSGVKPATIAKIMSDTGGDGLAVLCKATGLKGRYLEKLWHALRRIRFEDDGAPTAAFEHVVTTFSLLSVAKAQTALRYWDWALSSSLKENAARADAARKQEKSTLLTTPDAPLIRTA